MDKEYIIGFALVLVAIMSAYTMFITSKRRREKESELIEEKLPMLTNEEELLRNHIYALIGENSASLLKSPPAVYVIRDVNESVMFLNSTWIDYRSGTDQPKAPNRGYGGIYLPSYSIIYVNTDGWNNLHFAKVLIHEALHAVGYGHGDEMQDKCRDILRELKKEVSFI